MRSPSRLTCLLSVCEGIMAVIATACVWCMIMPCMKRISSAEGFNAVGRVEGGRTRLGSPGAPGCTTTAGCPVCGV